MPQQSFFDDDEDEDDFSYRAGPSRGTAPGAAGAPGAGAGARRVNGNANSTRTTSPSSRYGYAPRFASADVTGDTSFGQTTVDAEGGEEGDEAELDRILGREREKGAGAGARGEENEVLRLSRVWVRERGTGDIMRWEGELVEDCLGKLTQQAKMLDLLRSDPHTSEEEHFKLMLVQTEMERVKYLVRSYVRCRLAKVEKFSHYITLNPQKQMLLSQLELEHAIKYTEILHQHYSASVLESLPLQSRAMDQRANDGTTMVLEPDESAPVLIYCLRDCGAVQLYDTGDPAQLPAYLAPNSLHLIRYKLVKHFIADGSVEVL